MTTPQIKVSLKFEMVFKVGLCYQGVLVLLVLLDVAWIIFLWLFVTIMYYNSVKGASHS